MALNDAQWSAEVAATFAALDAGELDQAGAAARLTAATSNWPTRTLSNAALAQRVNQLLDQLAANPPSGGGPLPEGVLTKEIADGRYAMRATALTPEFLALRDKVKFFAHRIPQDISDSVSPNLKPVALGLLDIWEKPTLADRLIAMRELTDDLALPTETGPWTGTPQELAQQLIEIVKLLSPGVQGNGDVVQALGVLLAPPVAA